ncbi:unnamed protein product [Phytophthora fragariaefolia]|uniref:Unnamed protein product n=1 Tax=Phytophthora fragariaefolia TaxID=1490495 RepID=A0A9W6YJ41_9STRA|nr:unnamed protein product [Phytophthora fragariaefolia]
MVKVIEPNIDVPSEPTLAQMERAMAAMKRKEMSLRGAAKAFGVSRSSLHRRVTGQVPLNAKPGPEPIFTDGEVQGVLKAVDARTKRGLCFTRSELSMFIRQVVEESPYTREIPATFPSASWTNNFIHCNKSHFSRRQAQSLEVCRAKASTVENVDIHFNNLKEVFESCEGIPPSRIWNLDETGMCGQASGAKPKVLASKGYRANVQQSDSRVNVSALVCGNADGDIVPVVGLLSSLL